MVEEFQRAYSEIKADPAKIPTWQPIIAKYNLTLVGECEKAIKWSGEMAKAWLLTGMLQGDPHAGETAERIIKELSDHALTLSHARHLSAEKCRSIGMKISELEKDQKLQEAVLSVHHSCIHTLAATAAFKIIENHNGVAFIQIAQRVLLPRSLGGEAPQG